MIDSLDQFIQTLQDSGYAYKDLLKDFLEEQKRGQPYMDQLKRKLFNNIRLSGKSDPKIASKVTDLVFWHLQYARKKVI